MSIRKIALGSCKSQYILLDRVGKLIESCETLFALNSNNDLDDLHESNPIIPSLFEQLNNAELKQTIEINCVNFRLPSGKVGYVDITLSKNDHLTEILIEDFTSVYLRVAAYQQDRNNYASNSAVQKAKADVLEKSKAFMIHTFEDLSHELRNPLNSLVGLTTMISADGQEERVKALQSTAKLLVKIADNLLDISTLESADVKLKKNDIILKDIINDLKNTYMFQAAAKNLEFEVIIGAEVPKAICIDQSRLTQVLYNLLGNALKFTHKGKIRLLVTGGNKNICFEIVDTGIGIESKKLDSILSRFSQAHDDIHEIYGGLGLGLSISKQIVTLMEGVLDVKSVLHEGSNFSFKIPVTLSENDKSKSNNIDLTGLRVLLVDDDAMNLIVQKQQLEKIGLEVKTTNTGKDVLELLHDKKYDLLIVDYQMPEMDGKQVIDAVRKHFKIPIILLSGYSVNATKLQEAAPDRILTKPVTTETIIGVMSELFRK